MAISKSERHQIENEMIFRRANELIGSGLDDLNELHKEDGNPHLAEKSDIMLQFKCECSDEDCESRVPIRLDVYQKIHENRDAFIVKIKHQVNEIEKVIIEEDDYIVVEKNNSTPEPGETLNITPIDNS